MGTAIQQISCALAETAQAGQSGGFRQWLLKTGVGIGIEEIFHGWQHRFWCGRRFIKSMAPPQRYIDNSLGRRPQRLGIAGAKVLCVPQSQLAAWVTGIAT